MTREQRIWRLFGKEQWPPSWIARKLGITVDEVKLALFKRWSYRPEE